MTDEATTPLPWIDGPYGEIWVGVRKDLSGKWVEDGSAEIVATSRNPANRALVIRAVNAHDAMFKALGPLSYCDPKTPPAGVAIEDWEAAIEDAKEARRLALA